MSVEMNKRFLDDPLAFMDKYAVNPGDEIGDQKIKKLANYVGHDTTGDYFLKNVDPARRVGYLDFNKSPRSANLGALAGRVSITGSITPKANWVKSYYLPWGTNQIIRLNIPAMGTSLVDDDTRIFFTAAISGCSIFVKGTPQAPIILHAGGSTGKDDPTEAAAFWRDMAGSYAFSAGAVAEVNKTHYVDDVGNKSTTHSRAFEQWLKAEAKGDLNIESTAATGCVMGIRDLRGDWSFYLQENITIYHSKFKKGLFGVNKKKIVQGSQTTSVRPMLVRKFFPGGLGHATFVPRMPRAL